MDYCSVPEGMEGWVGLVGWPIADIYSQSGHMSTEDRRSNHWATQPTCDVSIIEYVLSFWRWRQ